MNFLKDRQFKVSNFLKVDEQNDEKKRLGATPLLIRRGPLQREYYMTMMVRKRLAACETLLPPTNRSIRSHVQKLAAALGVSADTDEMSRQLKQASFLMLPAINILLTGTACSRPLLFRECDDLARFTGADIILLRYDVDTGVTLDMKLQGQLNWLRHYAPYFLGGDVCFVPEEGSGPVLRASPNGMAVQSLPHLPNGQWPVL